VLVAAIPAHNEEATIEGVVAGVGRHVNLVLVVDDGSRDATAALAASAGAKVIAHRPNLGKGAALRTAIAWARSDPEVDELVLLDGDGQHDVTEVPQLVAERRRRALDIVVGSRFLGTNNAPFYRLLGLHVLSAAAALGSGVRLTDSQSGFRVLSRRAIELLELRSDSFAVESEMQYEAARTGLRMGEMPIHIAYEADARRNPVVHGVSVLVETIVMTARRRPARLPLLLGTPFLAFGISRRPGISLANRDDQAAGTLDRPA
jgi:glycosyltransferase involved in cell wall biosynthesis